MPESVARAGDAARFAWNEFFRAEIRNPHTRKAYAQAVRQFLESPDVRGVALPAVTPAVVGDYLDGLDIGPATKKLHLAGLRKFFDRLVLRHIIILNPAASVRGPRNLPSKARHRRSRPSRRGSWFRSAIADGDTWSEVVTFAHERLGWLCKFAPLAGGVPSDDTFGYIFAALDTGRFAAALLT